MSELEGRVYRMGVLNGPTHDPDEPREKPRVTDLTTDQLRAYVREAIREGYRTVTDMAEYVHAPATTVRNALAVLEALGQVRRTGGQGVPRRGRKRADLWEVVK